MDIGNPVRLKNRHDFRNGQPDLSEAVGAVCDVREEDGQKLVSVIFHEHHVLAPDVPVELFELATVH